MEIESLVARKEGQHFDRKSARMKPENIVKPVIAFANADGGTLAIGIEDNGDITGTGYYGAYSLTDYLLAIKEGIKPKLKVTAKSLSYINKKAEEDEIYLIKVKPHPTSVVESKEGIVYLRIGDKSMKQTPEQVAHLKQEMRKKKSFD